MSAKNSETNHRRRFWVVSVAVPLLISFGLVLLTLIWLPELPDPIAMHWSANEPDNFGNVWFLVLGIVIINLAFALFCFFAGRSPKNKNSLGRGAKVLGAISIWFSTMLSLGVGYSIYLQRGLSDATEAIFGNQIGLGLLISALIAFIAATIAWFLIPKDALIFETSEKPVRPIQLREKDVVSFIEDIGAPTWLQLTVALVSVGSVALLWYSTAHFLLTLGIGLLLLSAMSMLNVRISISNKGVKIASILGVPYFRIPLAEIQNVSIHDIDPAAEFGGWGFRTGFDGRFGVVMFKGEALAIERISKKRTFVATMEQPERAAEVLAGLVERHKNTSSGEDLPDSQEPTAGDEGTQ